MYRARDTSLKRDVALKILPESLAAAPDRLARFRREAEVLASLNHPNIAAIYGLQDADAIKALVMELVEGEDLAERIARGAGSARGGVADCHPDRRGSGSRARARGHSSRSEAGEHESAARWHGQVLDFALAKALERTAVMSGVSMSPTITSPAMTQAGVILGSAVYMSPEQARCKPADRRADIWAFGCVVFEMLAGRRPFADDDTVSDTLAGEYGRIRLSHNNRYVAFDRALDILLFDIERGFISRFVSNPAADFSPVWSPDDRRIAFSSRREPATNVAATNIRAGNLYERSVGGVATETTVFKNEGGKTLTDWSRDGRYLRIHLETTSGRCCFARRALSPC